MAIDPVSAGLAVASIAGGKSAQKKAEKQQRKAMKGQEAITQRAIEAYDKIMGEVDTAAKAGQFDPERIISGLQSDYEKDTKTQMDNVAGAFRVAGARPGDSETALNIRSVANQRGRDWDKLKTDIRRQSFLDKLAAYGSAANPGNLNLAANIYGQQGAAAQSPNPAGFYQGLMPFLGNSPQKASIKTAPDWLSKIGGFAGG